MLRRALKFVFDNSLALLVGAIAGVVWANADLDSYNAFAGANLASYWDAALTGGNGPEFFDLRYLVNDVLMAFFFALAGKEVWEAMLPGGPLHDRRRAAVPILCALGGMAGPAVIYVAGALALGRVDQLGRGWAIPCATDIAFSYLIARLVFGRYHSATAFLLLLAIADDAFGLIILALFYPVKHVEPAWLLITAGAVVLALVLRRMHVRSIWWYLIFPGTLSWAGLALSGLHPALGLLPIIPALPHGRTAEGVIWEPSDRPDALARLEAIWKRPVEIILGLFGLLNAGVGFSAFGATSYLVAGGLVIGKPVGIFVTGVIVVAVFRLELPQGVRWRELAVIGCAAGIGFTVALFVATVAFAPGLIQDEAKMGALASAFAVITAVAAARILRVKRTTQ